MKKLILLSTLISMVAAAKCPDVLLKKKMSNKTAYTKDLKKVSGQVIDGLSMAGCSPKFELMSKDQHKALLEAEYKRKLNRL